MFKKIFSLFLVIVMCFSLIVPCTASYASDTSENNISDISRLTQYSEIINTFGRRYYFSDYMRDHAGTKRPDVEYIIDAADYIYAEGMETRKHSDLEGMPGTSVWTDETGLIEWEVFVEQAGLYNISVLYFSYEGRNSDIQRSVFINDSQPFFEANSVEFKRTWVNDLPEILRDSKGNDLRPLQTETHVWQEVPIEDPLGTYNEPFVFYLEAGRNTLSFVSLREPMVIRSLKIHQIADAPPYAELMLNLIDSPRPGIETIRIDGQNADRKSSPMLAPQADNSGPGVTPYSPKYIRINYIGGYSWSDPGSWIEWDFEIPESGLYRIAMNVNQNFTWGANSCRRITINGKVPFQEMEAVPFAYASNWRIEVLGDDEPYLFWLEKGSNTIRMEAVLGDYAPIYREVQESVLNLNSLYRQIIMVTGLSPDNFRDYRIGQRLPNLRDDMILEKERIDRLFTQLNDISGGQSERDAVIQNASVMLSKLSANIENIPQQKGELLASISALGTWLMQVREQRLSVGEIYIMSADTKEPASNNGFFRRLWYGIQSLFYSFIIDVNTIGDTSFDSDAEQITVWVGTARDQANVIRSLIDEGFTRDTGINVDLKLVDMGTLLPSTLAGQGPDVALSVGQDLPMNFGMRGAVADLSGFPDFDEITKRFSPASMTPFTFDGRAFALPETITFQMLFYRKDVLYEIGLETPDTWDDVIASMSVLAQNHMEFGLPLESGAIGAPSATNLIDVTFGMFLFQNGGDFYTEDGSASALDSDISLRVFRDFARYYTDYGLPSVYDFANRFRTGDMPMAIADYTNYNMLKVFAPEISGLWGFKPVPGTVRADGSIDRTVAANGTSAVMMSRTENPNASWEFLKWWTSADTQLRYGRALESLMGESARHATANLEAFSKMPWPVQDYQRLLAQFEYVRGIPQVPGGYFTSRQLRNAFYSATEEKEVSPREALIEFVNYINEEIKTKRTEFGLD